MNTFENYYLTYWKSEIEEAKVGLKSYLIIKDVKNLIFHINSDERFETQFNHTRNLSSGLFLKCFTCRLVLLFQEVKWLSRLNIELPPSAKELLSQVG